MGLLVVLAIARTSGRTVGFRASGLLLLWMTGVDLLAGYGQLDQ
jgi:hypothetical protein